MVSGDVNANRMLVAMFDEDTWREDLPRLVRGALGRQQHGRWNTTVANAWGVLALGLIPFEFGAPAMCALLAGVMGIVLYRGGLRRHGAVLAVAGCGLMGVRLATMLG